MALKASLITALAASTSLAETVHSVLVFTRHGDRTAKFYSGYQMTNLGATQVYQSGQFYRQRYVQDGASSKVSGIAADRADIRQVWASAPDQAVLYQTATNFLQGLYPPLGDVDEQLATETLTNGTVITDPLNGYQFILVHGEGETDPDTIWIKGDDACPAYTRASKSYSQSQQYKTVLNYTADFYSQFADMLGPIMGAENVTYKNAYDVFDLLNVASIHNASVAPEINPTDLDQLRYLANEWEWNHNFNASQPDRSIGGMSLAGGILQRLQAAVGAGARRNKFQVMAGSYDTFLAFFGLTNLTMADDNFYGLPNYAASMVFELFTEAGSADLPAPFPPADAVRDELQVRFLFRNGSDASNELTAYPLFNGTEPVLSYGQFVDELSDRAINSLEQWCIMCGSMEDFCVAANATSSSSGESASVDSSGSSASGLSNSAAGGIGAGVTLAVVVIVAIVAWLVWRRKQSKNAAHPLGQEKRTSDSGSDSV